ncbi:predicted protein [Sclerotinia sclerotiorum 1980 UF-70]|uniref:Uncharacterized protein n=1 Tax=Sclerotinia sclerotiorum (strain ATCC 18683 / 1980 / Ss-1) TaxID=665079 RepID=A7E9X9_SCLS1|nr:predicted protein [Sclerotinia sclerotiorum 1980 UF-70]EDN97181.1 predicted protein [Sclerotinia sclerotiorum 1980 UF-70]
MECETLLGAENNSFCKWFSLQANATPNHEAHSGITPGTASAYQVPRSRAKGRRPFEFRTSNFDIRKQRNAASSRAGFATDNSSAGLPKAVIYCVTKFRSYSTTNLRKSLLRIASYRGRGLLDHCQQTRGTDWKIMKMALICEPEVNTFARSRGPYSDEIK